MIASANQLPATSYQLPAGGKLEAGSLRTAPEAISSLRPQPIHQVR